MEMNGTKPESIKKTEAHSSHLVTYQVCVDRDGEHVFDGTGQQFEDKAEAMAHLTKVQRERPHAYLAALTYHRCDEKGEYSSPLVHGLTEKLGRIAGLANLGLGMTEKIQAVASLLGHLRPSEEEDPGQIAEDLVLALEGMVEQLQVLHDLFDNIEIKAEHHEAPAPVCSKPHSAHPEPAMV